MRWDGVELQTRGNGSATARDADGARVTLPFSLEHNQSILPQLVEPHRFPCATSATAPGSTATSSVRFPGRASPSATTSARSSR